MALFVGLVDERIGELQNHVSGTSSGPGSLTQAQSESLPEALVDGACADMSREIQRLSARLSNSREWGVEAVGDFSYLLAAWADEALIRTFRSALPHVFTGAVEWQLSGTRDAGEQIFLKIDRVLARRSAIDTRMAGVYLLALSLGFRGKFSEDADNEVIHKYQRALVELATRQHVQTRVIQPAMVSPAEGRRVRLFGSLQPTALWAAVLAVWLAGVVSLEGSWYVAARTVRAHMDALSSSVKLTGLRDSQ